MQERKLIDIILIVIRIEHYSRRASPFRLQDSDCGVQTANLRLRGSDRFFAQRVLSGARIHGRPRRLTKNVKRERNLKRIYAKKAEVDAS